MANKVKFFGLIVAAGLSSTLSQANSEGTTTTSSNNSGFYTGALFGYSSMNVVNKEGIFVPGLTNEFRRFSYNSNGVVGTLLFGYRHFFTPSYFGGLEFGASWDNNSIDKRQNLNGHPTQTKLKGPFKFTPAVVLGSQFSENWLGFVKLGVSISRFDIYHSVAVTGFNPINGATNSFKQIQSGLMAALGLERSITKNISAVGLASYENFGKIQRTFTAVAGAPGESNHITLKPEYYTVKVGMTYKF